ncbi:hypothetical protein JL722_1013 [Aureococcus anophagefferens]|nr:hypothetical protein JL722_1013 [Aureococcus anophagefferens]
MTWGSDESGDPDAIGAEEKARELASLKELVNLNEELRRVEKETALSSFYGEGYTEAELGAKPMVLVIGQYSTGKTTLISSLCGGDYDGAHIGPEPTTEKFVAVVGAPGHTLPSSKRGNYVSMMPELPFGGLSRYGQAFLLGRFSASFFPEPNVPSLTQLVTFVDTPGVLSGEKQRVNRSYDFASVSRWFAERSELVLLLFDAHKLDISDEFRDIIAGLKGLEGRVRCVLNKADTVDNERLVRVYGALMFNVGKILQTPEVVRVFVGSFWDEPLVHAEYEKVFRKDRAALIRALIDEIEGLVRSTAARKVDDLVRRGRLALVHVRLCQHLRDTYAPGFLRRLVVPGTAKRAKKRALDDLDVVFASVLRNYGDELSAGDFPSQAEFRAGLRNVDLHNLPYASAEDRRRPQALAHGGHPQQASMKRRKRKRGVVGRRSLSRSTRRLLLKILRWTALVVGLALSAAVGAVAYAVLVDEQPPAAALANARDALVFSAVTCSLRLSDLVVRVQHVAMTHAAALYGATFGDDEDDGAAANATAAPASWFRSAL